MPELLAPAPSAEAVVAAVQAGADAIYIRFTGSGARGFTESGLRNAIRYCRVRGCRVYAELDTLITDREAAAAAELARRVCAMGADALIAQDLGFIAIARQAAPEIPVFAGERLGVHNAAGLEAMRQLGVTRVFLPRELTLAEIAALASRPQMELAVDLLDSLCPARAGQCALSALNGGGSASRGVCGGACREQYSLGGRMDDHPLSLADMDAVGYLPRLAALGVECVYVGRGVERPEQIARAMDVLRRCISEQREPGEQDIARVEEVFGERHFSGGYMPGAELGGLQGSRDGGGRAAERAMAPVRRGYANSEVRRVHIEFYAIIQRGKAVRFAVQDAEGHRALWNGPAPQRAQQRALTEQEVASFFRVTGRTPYVCDRVNVLADPGLALPQGMMAEAKRALIRSLTEKRGAPPERATQRVPPPAEGARHSGKCALIFETLLPEQLTPELAALRPDRLYVPADIIAAEGARLEPFFRAGVPIAAVLPRVIQDRELTQTATLLKSVRAQGVTEALCANLGHVALARLAGMEARGDFGLNIFNSYALELAKAAMLRSATASFELSLEQIKALTMPLDVEIIAYGRLPAMLTEKCLIKQSSGRCTCSAPGRLADERGGVMAVLREGGCRNAVYSAHKVFLADKAEELARAGVWGLRLLFTNESERECVEVAKSFLGQSRYRPNGATRGLYMKGV